MTRGWWKAQQTVASRSFTTISDWYKKSHADCKGPQNKVITKAIDNELS